MSWIRFFRRRRWDEERARELEAYLEIETDENMAGGMSPEEARYAAQRKLGNTTLIREEIYHMNSLGWLETFWQDLRYGIRMLAKSPGFTAVAVITLALGIGANTAIFSIVNAVVFRLLPYQDSERLVWLSETDLRERSGDMPVSPPTFLDWRSQAQSFEALSAYSEDAFAVTGRGEPENIPSAAVSSNFFELLGVQPEIGRSFVPEEDHVNSRPVVILSNELWHTRFGSDRGIVGRSITLDGKSHEVVGVVPPRFNYPPGTQIWTPLMPRMAEGVTIRGAHILNVVGRLKKGLALSQATAELNTIQRRIAQEDSDYRNFGVHLVPLQEHIVGDLRLPLLVLLGAVGFVLLIACTNVANLYLARAATRGREMAIRLAVGASGARIVRQLLTESTMIALAAGGLGTLLALWGVDALVALSPQKLPRADEIGVNGQVLVFALVASLLTGLLFGLAPALQGRKLDPTAELKGECFRLIGGPSRNRLSNLLVVSETALALVLLVGAGLMLNSFIRLLHVNLGFGPQQVIAFRLGLPDSRYPDPRHQEAFFQQLLERIKALPGVRSVGMGRNLPISGQSMTSPVVIEGRPARSGERTVVQRAVVDPGYFRAMGVRLENGRSFTEHDNENATPVVMVNQTFVRQFFPGENPLGKRLRTFFDKPGMREVVGVVGDVKHAGPAAATPLQVYVPYGQEPGPYMTVTVQTDAVPAAIIPAVRGAVLAIDKEEPIDQVATMESLFSESVAQPRFYSWVLGAFGAMALILTAVGIYGVMSYSVTQRVHEMGVRLALGAEQSDVLRLVIGQGLLHTGIGIAAGLAGALALTRFLSGLLYGVKPTDPLTLIAVSLILTAVATLACYIPARRATKVDPIVALRYE
jgi:putative ABC transport system permease protein